MTDVRLVGHVEDMPAACAVAHVAVVASTEPEAFGRVAIEAQAMGSPGHRHRHRRAARDRSGRSLRVPADEITGWLVPPGDAACLAERACAIALSLPRSRPCGASGSGPGCMCWRISPWMR